jgi:uncharacterized protein YcbK (DUF882 family)
MIKYKKGVPDGKLTLEMEFVKIVCESLYAKFGYDLVITSTYEDVEHRSKDSYHHTRDAIDIRINHVASEQKTLFEMIKATLHRITNCYDVIYYPKSHIHIEFDRRKYNETIQSQST